MTTGYAELVHLLKEPSEDNKAYANFAHDLVPETPGLVVVVHHGVAGNGKIAPSATVVKQLGPHPRPLMPEDDAVEEHRKEVVARRKAEAEAEAAAAEAARLRALEPLPPQTRFKNSITGPKRSTHGYDGC